MLLVLDVGNTQTSYGIFQDSKLVYHWRGETKSARTPDEYAGFLFPLLNHTGIKLEKIEGVAICSVVPPCNFNLKKFCESYLNKVPFFVSHENRADFTIEVETPSEVGADRLANTAYAVKHLKLPAIVVDLGTATTFDVITEDKVYQGGIILPGIAMGAESLSRKTSLLPLVPTDFPKKVIGKNTTTCIQSGILFGYCDAIDGLLTRLQNEIGKECSVALTGGISSLIHPHLKHKTQILPNLTLDGVEILYRKNS
jgi:type III pantothenate kinase